MLELLLHFHCAFHGVKALKWFWETRRRRKNKNKEKKICGANQRADISHGKNRNIKTSNFNSAQTVVGNPVESLADV